MPETLGQLRSAPLVYVVAEIRHAVILDGAARTALIRNMLRDSFPNVAMVQRALIGAPVAAMSDICMFADLDERAGLSVSPTNVVFHATRYSTSDEFFAHMQSVLTLIQDVYAGEWISRLGLRYVDAITPAPGEKMSEYLDARFLGPRMPDTEPISTTVSADYPRDGGILRVRCINDGTPRYVPPDILNLLKPPQWTVVAAERHRPAALLDSDRWLETKQRFDVPSIMETFKQLKRDITVAFKSITTEHAREIWAAPGDPLELGIAHAS